MKNGLRTEDTEDTTPFGGAYINKDGITLRGAIFVSIGKQSPLTVKTLTAHPLTLSSPYRGIEGVRHLLQ